MKRTLLVVASVVLVIVLAVGVAFFLPGQTNISDFIILFSATLGVVHHVPLYDNAAISALTAVNLSAPANFTVFPYPYPPWYALGTFYLGFLPLAVAANAWMMLNIAMLFTCVMLLTDGWRLVWRVVAGVAAVLFLPSLGLLIVGQYSVPVLLGAAVFIHAVRREAAPSAALGLLLMTFKPHIGLFLLPIGFIWLALQKTAFARRAIWLTLGGAAVLFALGFIADPAWPLTYLHSVLSYTTLPGVANRDLSASFPVLLVKLATGQSSALWASWLSVVFALGLLVLFWRSRVFADVGLLIACVVLMTLLADPYLFNYDYVLLLLPLIYLVERARSLAGRLLLAIVYLVPWISLVLAREANIFYALSALLLLVLLLRGDPLRMSPPMAA